MEKLLKTEVAVNTDDAKLLRSVSNNNNGEELNSDLNDTYVTEVKRWDMQFNAQKCHLIEMGKQGNETRTCVCGKLNNNQSSLHYEYLFCSICT